MIYEAHKVCPASGAQVTQLKFRLGEGNGECFYYLGVHDDGNLVGLPEGDLASSLDTLHAMAAEVGATATVVRRLAGAGGRHCAIMRVVRAAVRRLSCTDLRIAGLPLPLLPGCCPACAVVRVGARAANSQKPAL